MINKFGKKFCHRIIIIIEMMSTKYHSKVALPTEFNRLYDRAF